MSNRRDETKRVPVKPSAARTTVVWGQEVERGDFIKVPRTLTRLGRYSSLMGKELQPRHILLILSLAGRRYQDAPLNVTWKELARDLGIRPDTARHWAYELREMKVLKITPLYFETRDGKRRARGVELDMSGFVDHVRQAYLERRRQNSQPVFNDEGTGQQNSQEDEIDTAAIPF